MEGKKALIWALVLLALLLLIIFFPGFSELQERREENEQLLKRIELLENHNEMLKEEISRMKQDPDYAEEKAREKLGIIKKGEMIYKGRSEDGTGTGE